MEDPISMLGYDVLVKLWLLCDAPLSVEKITVISSSMCEELAALP